MSYDEKYAKAFNFVLGDVVVVLGSREVAHIFLTNHKICLSHLTLQSPKQTASGNSFTWRCQWAEACNHIQATVTDTVVLRGCTSTIDVYHTKQVLHWAIDANVFASACKNSLRQIPWLMAAGSHSKSLVDWVSPARRR